MVYEGPGNHHAPISLLLSLGCPWFWFDRDASRPTGAGREEFQVKGNNVVIAEGRSLVCKPRKMRQVRVTTQEGKQGPGNQTRSLETRENGSKMKADMKSSSQKSPSKLVALHPGHIWQSPVPCPSSSTRFGFQVIPVGLLCPYCNGDLPAKNKNDLIVYFLRLKNTFFFPFNLSNFQQNPTQSVLLLWTLFSFAFMTPSLTLYIYVYISCSLFLFVLLLFWT